MQTAKSVCDRTENSHRSASWHACSDFVNDSARVFPLSLLIRQDSAFDTAAKSCIILREGLLLGGDGWVEFPLFVDHTRRLFGTPNNFLWALLVASRSLPSSLYGYNMG